MLDKNFGIEIELTGMTRKDAAKIVADHFESTVEELHGTYDTRTITAPDGRIWKIVYDSSITPQKKVNGQIVISDDTYKVELVSPILTYREDIESLQELIRKLRRAGGLTNGTCGIHIHLNGADHDARSVKNFINIIASKNDLLYKALQVEPDRMRYCKKMDEYLIEKMNSRKPKTLADIEKIWYEGYRNDRYSHYHQSRYHFLNLHSMFHGVGTLELRGFNSTLHAGKVRSYVVLALALNNQALTQKCASAKKPQSDNERFAMRTFLNRIGFIGDEFKNCREHLCRHLSGSAAWRYGTPTNINSQETRI